MVNIAVVGATGYTARELLRILSRHSEAEVSLVTSRSSAGQSLAELHPSLAGLYDLDLVDAEPESIGQEIDFVFCCLPHAASAEWVCRLPEHVKVVDFSADYRLNDVDTYETWYQVKHPEPNRVGTVAYGLPECFRQQITDARVVANPGCFPTSVILPLVPLVNHGLIELDGIIVDSKTGISGAGRNPSQRFHFPEANESVAAYSVGKHRHAPEMQQIVERATGKRSEIIFTPHVVPMNQGILSTIYIKPSAGTTAEKVMDAWRDAYQHEKFVRIVDTAPTTAQVAHSNFCDLWCGQNGSRLTIVSAIDNLIKGASGAAVQNFNLMNGLEETTSLL